MLSVGVIAPSGVGYYVETVASGVDDYYARTEPGRWVGAGSTRLGLAGQVDAGQIAALVGGRDPVTGSELGARSTKVAALDLTLSAPKSVSLLGELGDADTRAQVSEAHRAAVAATVAFLEAEGAIAGRRGSGGVRRVATEGAVAAAFDHRTSRAGDPQLHTHVLLFNRALGVDGRWGAVDGRLVFGWARTAGFVYQAALRAEVTERLGVAWRPAVNGLADIAGFTDAQLEEFSTRRTQIADALDHLGQRSARAAQVATLATRPAKPGPLDPDRQRADWWQRAETAGITAEVVEHLRHRTVVPAGVDLAGLADELASPVTGPTANRSAFDRRDVIRALCETATAGIPVDHVGPATDRLLGDSRLAPTGGQSRLAGPLYSTRELLETETRLLAAAAAASPADRLGVCDPTAVEAAITARPTLSGEQETMVRRICGDGRAVQAVIGRAGTGKTFALDTARQAWADSGRTVIGAALAARTAAALQAGTGIASTTVDQLLSDIARPGPGAGLPRHGVLVIDEAGLVGTRKLAALLTAADKARAKVVLVGDPRQLPEVEAGGAFAALARLDPIELTVNRRQEQEWERAALDQVRHGDVTRAVTVYRDHQRINLTPSYDQAVTALVADWHAAHGRLGPEGAVMIALHQADVDALNHAARQALRADGQLTGPTVSAVTGRVFAVGDQVMALRNDRRLGLTNGTRGSVTALDPTGRSVTVVTADGRELMVPAGYLDDGHLTHGYALTAHKAQGLTVTRAFVLGSDRLYREAGYTLLSRATERSDLYQVAPPAAGWQPAPDPHADLARLLGRSGAQTLATLTDPVDRAAIRDAALADPGAHLLDRLGPPPPAGPARAAWAAAATAIDTYRHRHAITGPDPLGPPPADPDIRRQYDHAQAAARQVDRHLELTPDLGLGL